MVVKDLEALLGHQWLRPKATDTACFLSSVRKSSKQSGLCPIAQLTLAIGMGFFSQWSGNGLIAYCK